MTDVTSSAKTGKTDSSSLYPIAVLIDELRDDDQKKRITAIQSFATICIALGPERTRNELLPYILELLEEDEEVLTALAEVLGTVLDHVGGPSQAEHLLRVLERLCLIEELAVREKVTTNFLHFFTAFLNLLFRRPRASRRSCPLSGSRTSSPVSWA